MKLYPLTIVQVLILLVLVAAADLFTVVQGAIVPAEVRPFTYLLFVIVALLAFFVVVRPGEWTTLAGTLALALGIIAIVLVIVQDVIIAYRLSWRTAIVILGAVIGPYIAGWGYGAVAGRAR